MKAIRNVIADMRSAISGDILRSWVRDWANRLEYALDNAELSVEESVQRDAERYRYLRANGFSFSHDEEKRGISCSKWGDWSDFSDPVWVDAAIDRARKQERPAPEACHE